MQDATSMVAQLAEVLVSIKVLSKKGPGFAYSAEQPVTFNSYPFEEKTESGSTKVQHSQCLA